MSGGLGASLDRVMCLAGTTLRELVRQRLVLGLGVSCVLVVLLIRATGALELGQSGPQLAREFGMSVFSFFGAALALGVGVQQFFDELNSGRAEALWAKPLRRGEWLVGKWLGLVVLLGAFCAAAALGVLYLHAGAAVGVTAEEAQTATLHLPGWSVAAWALLQWLKLGVLTAMTLLVCTLVRGSNLALLLGLGVIVASHVQPAAVELYRARHAGPWAHVMGRLLELWPNLLVFEPSEGGVNGLASSFASAGGMAYAGAYAFIYTAGLLVVGTLVLRQREQ